MPKEIEYLDMHIRYRGHSIDVRLDCDSITLRGHNDDAPPISLLVDGGIFEFTSGMTREFKLDELSSDKNANNEEPVPLEDRQRKRQEQS